MVLERVQKIISNCGYCSRRNAEDLIEYGKVSVNGKIIHLGDKADVAKDTIIVEGHKLKSDTKKIYIMLHKPKYYVTTTKDPFCSKTVMQLIDEKERVYPVGRLDALTTGLLLLTNDGDFANKIMHPKYEKEKTYHVVLDQPLLGQDRDVIEGGIKFPDFQTGSCKIEMLEPNELNMTIHEGQNKEIKKIFKIGGYHVDELHRFKVGKLELDIPEGKYRYLTKKEVEMLLSK
ncbi:MAG: pseudouridine synthase [Candidatus Woesearchaeota archaeon]|jgi:23S rRNA pseudouridine2605 synthase